MSRPSTIVCEGCDELVVQQRLGAPKRFCPWCLRARQRARTEAWKAANPEACKRHRRDADRRKRLGLVSGVGNRLQ